MIWWPIKKAAATVGVNLNERKVIAPDDFDRALAEEEFEKKVDQVVADLRPLVGPLTKKRARKRRPEAT